MLHISKSINLLVTVKRVSFFMEKTTWISWPTQYLSDCNTETRVAQKLCSQVGGSGLGMKGEMAEAGPWWVSVWLC